MDPGRWADDWERWLPLLERLSLARALSGWEDAVRDVLLRALPPRLPRRADAVGNLLVEAGGGSGPRVMVAAHMDEVGLVVSAVEADGFLRVKAVGGVDPQVLPGRAVRVGDGQGLPGVVAHRPLHLQDRRERQQAVRLEDVRVDVGGLHREEVVSLVPVGAPVTFEPVFAPFGEGRVRGKAFD
ncbi:MAG: M42 family peptidase, partial [Clostridia bacterium]|nr:M42 family peptidase [Clostridia bacterium]